MLGPVSKQADEETEKESGRMDTRGMREEGRKKDRKCAVVS